MAVYVAVKQPFVVIHRYKVLQETEANSQILNRKYKEKQFFFRIQDFDRRRVCNLSV